MNHLSAFRTSRQRRIAAVFLGVAATALMTGGVADAAPPAGAPVPKSTRVPNTNCTLGQVEKALAKEDPATWNSLQSSPQRRAYFEQNVVLTPEQRQARLAKWKRMHPNEASAVEFLMSHGLLRPIDLIGGDSESPAQRAAVKARVKATCSKY